MRRVSAFKRYGGRTILLIGVLTCLCFSSGEGLRLMPISYLATGEAGSPNFRTTIASLNISLSYQYATCGLEKSGQKLTQRQPAHSKLLTSRHSGESFPVRAHLIDDVELTLYRSLLSVSRPLGRAPPSA